MKIIERQKVKPLYLLLELKSNSSKSPEFGVEFNGTDVTEQGILSGNTCAYELTFEDTPALSITFTNKGPADTVMNGDEILEDLAVIVKKLVIQGIDFTSKLNQVFTYTDTENNQHQTYGFMHRNGTMVLNIQKNILYTDWLYSI